MSLQSAPSYWIECDGCKTKPDSDYGGWPSAEEAEEQALIEDDFIRTEDGKHYCSDCSYWCPVCDEIWIPKTEKECHDCKEFLA